MYKEFQLKDAAGIVRTINLSTDPRYPVAMDGGPVNFMRRRPARDEEGGGPDLPDQLDDATALTMISQILKRVADPGVLLGQIARRYEHSDESGMDVETEFPERVGFVPAAGGMTAAKLDVNSRPRSGGARDAALAMDQAESSLAQRDPVLAGYISRIKTYGY
jgi:hypothetical protein